MSTKTDILIQGVSNAEHSYKDDKKSYAKCPECHSVNCKVLIEDEDIVTFQCLECEHSFWKTKL